MNCQDIETELNKLKVNSLGSVRGKGRVTDKIHSLHLKKLDNELMDIRVFVAGLANYSHSKDVTLKMIDEFIYKKQP